jgi:hypothetical protein
MAGRALMGISEAGAQRARALMAGSEFPSLEQPRGRRSGAAGIAGSARRGRREHERERERTAGRTVHQKSVYVYTMVLYSSRDVGGRGQAFISDSKHLPALYYLYTTHQPPVLPIAFFCQFKPAALHYLLGVYQCVATEV